MSRTPAASPVARFAAVVLVSATAACSRNAPETAPVATPSVTLNHNRAPAGSPLEITYRFVVDNSVALVEDYRVFVHVMDADDERMWGDDHEPPIPTRQWKAGQTIEYTRTIFVPVFPYVGQATVRLGLHSVRDQSRLTLKGENAGQHSYTVARLELLPQTDNLFTVFKDGWHPAEVSTQDGTVEWQWTRKEASLAFKNPKKDVVLFLDLDSPSKALHGDQQVEVTVGGQVQDSFALVPDERVLRKVKLPSAVLGATDLAELHISVDKTFVPAVVTSGTSKDPRELGVRVFHAYVDPR